MNTWHKISLSTIACLIIIFFTLKLLNVGIVINSGPITYNPVEFQPQAPLMATDNPKNIIVFIADGMGFGHLSLAQLIQKDGPDVWSKFETRGWHDTRCSYGPLTDSGASATAIATGVTTFFDVIGMDDEGNSVPNLFELATHSQYNTGIVTDSYVWDATPAAFVTHTRSRDNSEDILRQLAASELDVLFGELEDLGEDGNPDLETTMEILSQRFHQLDHSLEIPTRDSILLPIAAIFEEDQVQDINSDPSLTKMTTTALEYLSSQDQPFVLLVESEEIDAASHSSNTKRMVRGLESIQHTLAVVLEFASKNKETLVLFTSDHETGGMAFTSDSGIYPDMRVIWGTRDHTGSFVPILATGPGASLFTDVKRNAEIGLLLKQLISKP